DPRARARPDRGVVPPEPADERRPGRAGAARHERGGGLGDRSVAQRSAARSAGAATAYAVAENLARIQGSGGAAVSRLREYLNSVRERCPECDGLLIVDERGRLVTSVGAPTTAAQVPQASVSGLRTTDVLVGPAYGHS